MTSLATPDHATPARLAPPRRPSRAGGRPPWLWLLPLGLVLAVVLVYPIAEIIRLSFTDASLVAGEDYSFTLGGYGSLLRGDDFRHTVGITFLFVLLSTVFQLALGLAAALVVHGAERHRVRGTVVTRTAVLTAWMLQENTSGIANYALSKIGGSGTIPFLSDPTWALVSVTAANVWRGTALSMILCYAGLKTIPDDVYEAARMDGAGPVATLTRVVLPLMRPVLLTNLVLVLVETFNTFDMVLALTEGGPGTSTQVLALAVHDQIFRQLNLGRGAAMAVVLLAINVLVIAVYLRLVERQERSA